MYCTEGELTNSLREWHVKNLKSLLCDFLLHCGREALGSKSTSLYNNDNNNDNNNNKYWYSSQITHWHMVK